MPDYKKIVLPTPPPEPDAPAVEGGNTVANILAAGSRIAGPYLGGLVGAAGGTALLPGAGTVGGGIVGSAAGGAAGESLAEWLEGSKQSGKRIALEAALSSIPGGMLIKEGRPIASAVRSAVNVGAGTVARKVVNSDKDLGEATRDAVLDTASNPADLAMMAGGAGLGGWLANRGVKAKTPGAPTNQELLDKVKTYRKGTPDPQNPNKAIPVKLSNAEHKALLEKVRKDPSGPVAREIGVDSKAINASHAEPDQLYPASHTEVNSAQDEALGIVAKEKKEADAAHTAAGDLLTKERQAADVAKQSAGKVPANEKISQSSTVKNPDGSTTRVSKTLVTPDEAAAAEVAKKETAARKIGAASRERIKQWRDDAHNMEKAEDIQKNLDAQEAAENLKEGKDETRPSIVETSTSIDPETGKKTNVKKAWVDPPPEVDEDGNPIGDALGGGGARPEPKGWGKLYDLEADAKAHAERVGGIVKRTTKGFQVQPPEAQRGNVSNVKPTSEGGSVNAEDIGLDLNAKDITPIKEVPPGTTPTVKGKVPPAKSDKAGVLKVAKDAETAEQKAAADAALAAPPPADMSAEDLGQREKWMRPPTDEPPAAEPPAPAPSKPKGPEPKGPKDPKYPTMEDAMNTPEGQAAKARLDANAQKLKDDMAKKVADAKAKIASKGVLKVSKPKTPEFVPEPHDFKVGDEVNYLGNKVKVTSVNGDDITVSSPLDKKDVRVNSRHIAHIADEPIEPLSNKKVGPDKFKELVDADRKAGLIEPTAPEAPAKPPVTPPTKKAPTKAPAINKAYGKGFKPFKDDAGNIKWRGPDGTIYVEDVNRPGFLAHSPGPPPPTEPPPAAPVPKGGKPKGPKNPKGGASAAPQTGPVDHAKEQDTILTKLAKLYPEHEKNPQASTLAEIDRLEGELKASKLAEKQAGANKKVGAWQPQRPEVDKARLTPEVKAELEVMAKELEKENHSGYFGQTKAHRDIQDNTPHAPVNGKKTNAAKLASQINQQKAAEYLEQVRKDGLINNRHHEGVVAAAEARVAKNAARAAEDAKLAESGVNKVDTLDTGEVQPRLPGAEDVRETNIETPKVAEDKFALGGEAPKAEPKKTTGDLLAVPETDAEKLARMERSITKEPNAQIRRQMEYQRDLLKKKIATGTDQRNGGFKLNGSQHHEPKVEPETPTPKAEEPVTSDPVSQSSEDAEWADALDARETDIDALPDPKMVENSDASSILKSLQLRAQKLGDLYRKYQDEYKLGQRGNRDARSAGAKAAEYNKAANELEVEETLALNPDEVAAPWPPGKRETRYMDVETGTKGKTKKVPIESFKHEADIPVGGNAADDIEKLGDEESLLSGEKKPLGFPRLMTKAEVAEKLGTSERTVERMSKTGKLRAIPIAVGDDTQVNTVRFRPEEVDDYLAANGVNGYKGPRNRNSEAGFIDPRLSLLMSKGVLGAAGAGIGAVSGDEENRGRNALIGGALGVAGPSAIEYMLKHHNDNGAVQKAASAAANAVPQYTRFNMLAQFPNLIYNAHLAPWTAGIMTAIEHGLTESPQEGLDALKRGWNPVKFAKDMGGNWQQAVETIGRNERGELMMGEVPNKLQKALAAPGTAMTAGDVTARTNATDAGIAEEVARRGTLTYEPWSKTGKRLTDFSRGNPMGAVLLPFARTASNVVESGLERTPFIGFLTHIARERATGVPVELQKKFVQQGLGGTVAFGAYMLGKELPPDQVKLWKVDRMIGNLGGQYSMLAAAGFAAGQAAQQGKSQLGAFVKSPLNDLPLPTTQTPLDIINTIGNVASGKPAHAHAKPGTPEYYLPNVAVPGFARTKSQEDFLTQLETLKNLGGGGAAPTPSNFSFLE